MYKSFVLTELNRDSFSYAVKCFESETHQAFKDQSTYQTKASKKHKGDLK